MDRFLGYPLEIAVNELKQEGRHYTIVDYIEPKGHILGDDKCVVAVCEKSDIVELTVAQFKTRV